MGGRPAALCSAGCPGLAGSSFPPSGLWQAVRVTWLLECPREVVLMTLFRPEPLALSARPLCSELCLHVLVSPPAG